MKQKQLGDKATCGAQSPACYHRALHREAADSTSRARSGCWCAGGTRGPWAKLLPKAGPHQVLRATCSLALGNARSTRALSSVL